MTAQKQNITLKKQNGYFVHAFLQHPLFSPLFKKKTKQNHTSAFMVKSGLKNKKLNGKQVALHHDGRRDKTELF